jgi:hypothetical protein
MAKHPRRLTYSSTLSENLKSGGVEEVVTVL